jgi:hypothetical protein
MGRKMAYMTETDALDEELTRTTPGVDFGKPDVFIRQRELLGVLNPIVPDYILARALSTHQTPAQIIGEPMGKNSRRSTGLTIKVTQWRLAPTIQYGLGEPSSHTTVCTVRYTYGTVLTQNKNRVITGPLRYRYGQIGCRSH